MYLTISKNPRYINRNDLMCDVFIMEIYVYLLSINIYQISRRKVGYLIKSAGNDLFIKYSGCNDAFQK